MPKDMPAQHHQAVDKKLFCASCQWFSSGLNGQTCRKLREVEVTTPACVEYTIIMKDPFHEVARDKKLLQIREVFGTNKAFLIHPDILSELASYATKLREDFVDKRFGTAHDLHTLQQGLFDIVSFRARVSSIYTNLLDIQYEVEKNKREANSWLYSKYDVWRDLKNEGSREAAFDRIIPEVVGIQSSLNKAIATAKYIDDVLNKNDWTLRTILESVQRSQFRDKQ